MALPVEERLELARRLLESAEPTTAMTAQADDSQAVIERRAEEVRRGTATMIPASDVFQRLAMIAPDHP